MLASKQRASNCLVKLIKIYIYIYILATKGVVSYSKKGAYNHNSV
jgi:hypothetical protein